jgi:hypothetical protein
LQKSKNAKIPSGSSDFGSQEKSGIRTDLHSKTVISLFMSTDEQVPDRSRFRSFRDLGTVQALTLASSRRGPRPHFPLSIRRIPSADGPRLPAFRTYECRRRTARGVRGTKILFSLRLDGAVRLSAKFKDGGQNAIPIASGTDVHLGSDSWDGVLLHGNGFSDFSLRTNSRTGREVLSLQFRTAAARRVPRTLSAFFFSQPPSCPPRLTSADPTETDAGWILDIGREDALTSIKNCRLEAHGRPYVYVRKTAKNVLELEAKAVIDELAVFAIAIGSFLCHR